MKKLFYISLVFTLFNCSSEKQPILKSDVKEKSEATKFTFSQPLIVDFMVAEGQYQILYDYSRPVDTIFANSGAFVVGKDSILYTQLRKSKLDELADYQNSKCYHGDPTNLILYDGNQFKIID